MTDLPDIAPDSTGEIRPHGLLVIDKPPGPTSYDVIRILRSTCGISRKWKVGHLGTLDPFASGVMVIALGQAVKYAEYASRLTKIYRARLWLGDETDTLDPTGKVTASAPVPLDWRDRLEDARQRFLGETKQTPPIFSAKQVDGTRAYQSAREGKAIELRPAKVKIHALDITGCGDQWVDFECTVSSGTYVRSLGRDLARDIGTVGHLVGLERLAVGPLNHDISIPLQAFDIGGIDVLMHHLRPVQFILQHLPTLTLRPGAEFQTRLLQGKRLGPDDFLDGFPEIIEENATFVIIDPSGSFLSMGRPSHHAHAIVPFKPWLPE